MAIELRQQLKLTQQLVMTPQLQMAIKLLQLSRLELLDAIRQEMEENPAIEEVQETLTEDREADLTQEDKTTEGEKEKEVTIAEDIHQDIDWSNYIEEYNTPGRTNFEYEEKDSPKFEAFVGRKETLSEHLLWQLLMASPTDREKEIGTLIIGNLSRDGYLDMSVDDLVKLSGASEEEVEDVLWFLQSFDPPGICARDLSECLLNQARQLGLDNSIITEILTNHLNHLENKNYKAIAKSLKISMERVIEAVNVIKGLEPKPGRQFSDDDPQYISPDIYVYKMEDDFVIVLNEDGMPKLRVSTFYQNALRNGGVLREGAKEYMNEKMRSAAWLIKSIHQRQKTIYKVMESILKCQRPFFEKGIAYLKPMVLRDVAQDINMHESTISRVTTNKYAYTPQGIFELKYFFNSSINRIQGGSVASASVQEKIKQIIDRENPKKPLSDDKISKILKEDNIDIARRTVAKYREILGILPSNKRKQY